MRLLKDGESLSQRTVEFLHTGCLASVDGPDQQQLHPALLQLDLLQNRVHPGSLLLIRR